MCLNLNEYQFKASRYSYGSTCLSFETQQTFTLLEPPFPHLTKRRNNMGLAVKIKKLAASKNAISPSPLPLPVQILYLS